MNVLTKIISFLLLRKTMTASSSLIGSLLVGMAVVLILSLIATTLLASMIFGGIYMTYYALIASGMLPLKAAAIVGMGVLLLFVAVVYATIYCVRKLTIIPRRLIDVQSRIPQMFIKTVDAFIDGFTTPTR